MTAPQDAIRARRKLTNKLIAAHDAPRLKPFFAPDANLISGEGGLLMGAPAIIASEAAASALYTLNMPVICMRMSISSTPRS